MLREWIWAINFRLELLWSDLGRRRVCIAPYSTDGDLTVICHLADLMTAYEVHYGRLEFREGWYSEWPPPHGH